MSLKNFDESLEACLNEEMNALTNSFTDPFDWLENFKYVFAQYDKKFKGDKKLFFDYVKFISDYSAKLVNRKPGEPIYNCSPEEIVYFKEIRVTAHQSLITMITFKSLIDNPPDFTDLIKQHGEKGISFKETIDKIITYTKTTDLYKITEKINIQDLKVLDDVFSQMHDGLGLL